MVSTLEHREGDIFQIGILQRISGVFGSRNICDQIDSHIELWNKGVYDELVKNYHRDV